MIMELILNFVIRDTESKDGGVSLFFELFKKPSEDERFTLRG
jgi:hypothetical protein